MSAEALIPPVPETAAGRARRVGVELELSGLTLASIVELVVKHFGGDPQPVSEYEVLIAHTSVGEFRVELDFQYLKNRFREDAEPEGFRREFQRLSVGAMAEIAKLVVPMEIVTPPLEPAHLPTLDAMVADLREHGGLGTRHSTVYAFGLHLNPEVPALDAGPLLRYLQAFLCLHDWLLEVEEVDWSRRVTPYINPFPRAYVQRVLAPGYAPGTGAFIDDYLAFNADRNRALDLLPLFTHIDERRVRSVMDDPRIKARPTFHYRLPNCDVDLDGWGVTGRWQNWLAVERLAEDSARLGTICDAYGSYLDRYTLPFSGEWAARSREWLR